MAERWTQRQGENWLDQAKLKTLTKPNYCGHLALSEPELVLMSLLLKDHIFLSFAIIMAQFTEYRLHARQLLRTPRALFKLILIGML